MTGSEKQIDYAETLRENAIKNIMNGSEVITILFSNGLTVNRQELIDEYNNIDDAGHLITVCKSSFGVNRIIAKKYNIKGA